MLDTLRANSRSVLTYVLFGIIIIVFVVSFGPGSKGCGAAGTSVTWAAKVNGTEVTPAEYEQQYGQLLRMVQVQGLRDLDPALQVRIRQLAMDGAVQRALIQDEARRQGLVVTDDDVAAAIKAIPSFQRDGRFDLDLYKRAVTASYGSPSRFEDGMRRDLYQQKMLAVVHAGARVTEEEVKEAWRLDGDRIALQLVRFPLGLARAEAKATDAQVQQFLAQNGAKVDAFYKDNPARFDKKKRIHARHILVKVDEKADQAAQDAAKKKIDDVEARLKKGEDFAKVAAEVSDDPGSKTKGGDLGFFGEGMMVKPFEDAAFKLKPNEISAPVRTAFGWHVIQVLGVEEPEKVSLEKARPEIAREMVENDLAKKVAHDRAEDLLKKLQAGKALTDLIPADDKAKGPDAKLGGEPLRVDETGAFPAASAPNVPRVGPAPELFADALKANPGDVLPKVYETAGGPVVVRVKDRQRPDEAKFAAEKGEVEERLRYRREAELERAWLDGLKAKAKITTNPALLAGATSRAPVEPE